MTRRGLGAVAVAVLIALATGCSDSGTAETAIAPGLATAPSSTTTTAAPPAAPAPTDDGPVADPLPDRSAIAGRPLRVLLAGDSLMYDAAPGIQRALEPMGADVMVQAGLGTGLTNPEVVDWPVKIRETAASFRPDVVVLMIGAWDLLPRTHAQRTLQPGTLAWRVWYRSLAHQYAESASATGAEVFWLGIPHIRPAAERYVPVIDQVFRQVADERAGVLYLDTAAALEPPGGGYADAVPGPNGPIPLRKPDGVHFLDAGADRIGAVVAEPLRERWGLGGT